LHVDDVVDVMGEGSSIMARGEFLEERPDEDKDPE
jgi:hypothetical protein